MKTAIIGGGACGLLLASLLDRKGLSYTVFNHGRVGNKILASGNGRCNIANLYYEDLRYHNNPLATKIVSENQKELFELFRQLGIYTKADSEGRLYPISESSQSVLNVLLNNIHTPIVSEEITKIERKGQKYFLNELYGPYDQIVLACGSTAGYKNRSDFWRMLSFLKLKVIPFIPSLVGFKTSLNLHSVAGARCKCMASLYQGNRLIHQEYGEVIFKEDGISGICIMNLSSYYAHLPQTSDCQIRLDCCYGQNYEDYTTVLQPKLLNYILKYAIDVHSFCIPVTGVYDLEFAQVCHGGIDLSELTDGLRLKKDRNIFAGGEMVDVDGVCGGYNLMFAFCCGMVIFKELTHEISD